MVAYHVIPRICRVFEHFWHLDDTSTLQELVPCNIQIGPERMSFSKLPCGLMVSEENSRFDVLGSNPTILKVLFLSFFPVILSSVFFLVCIEMNMHAHVQI